MKMKLPKKLAALGISIIMLIVSASYQGPTARVHAASAKSTAISSSNVKKGKIILNRKNYENLTIKKSVGKANIQLKNVKITGTLTLESGAAYKISMDKSKINKIVVKAPVSSKKTKALSIEIKGSSSIKSLNTAANLSLKDNGKMKCLTVSPRAGKSITVSLSGFKGDMKVKNAKKAAVSVKTSSTIKKMTVSGRTSGMKLTVTDTSRKKNAVLKNVFVIDPLTLKLNIAATKVTVDKRAAKLSLTLNKNISSLSSKAPNASIGVEEGTVISSVTTEGAGTKITGKGQIKKLLIKGNNTKVTIKVNKVAVAKNVTGVVVNGKSFPEKEKEEEQKPVIKEFKVTFDAGEGIITGDKSSKVVRTVKENALISNVPMAERKGYHFLGWSTTGTGNVIDFKNYKTDRDITLKAVYRELTECKVTFDAGNGFIEGTQDKTAVKEVEKNTLISEVPRAELEYYEFLGWSTTGTGTVIDFKTFKSNKDVTLKAVYKEKLQMCLRCTTDGRGITYNSTLKKMVFAGTETEADSPREPDSHSGLGGIFILDNLGENKTAALAVYSLSAAKVTIRLTKGIDYPGTEVITGTKISGYDKDGMYYEGLEEGEYRITSTLKSDPNKIVSRPFYVRKGVFGERKVTFDAGSGLVEGTQWSSLCFPTLGM